MNIKKKKVISRKKLQDSEEFVKNSIIPWLNKHDWNIIKIACPREHGADIIAQKRGYGIRYIIDTKGSGVGRGIQDANFVHVVGQIVTRKTTSKNTRYKYGIGIPTTIVKIALRRLPYEFMKKNMFYILSVDEKGKVKEYSWKEAKHNQK